MQMHVWKQHPVGTARAEQEVGRAGMCWEMKKWLLVVKDSGKYECSLLRGAHLVLFRLDLEYF